MSRKRCASLFETVQNRHYKKKHPCTELTLIVHTGTGKRVVWRTDLRATERHWRGWFEGLSSAFLALPLPKASTLEDGTLSEGHDTGVQLGP